jgi:LysM repeat protein
MNTSRAALASGLGLLLFAISPAAAQEPEAASPAPAVTDPMRELRAIRQTLEKQTRLLEAITQQVSKLSQNFDAPPKATPAEAPPSPEGAPASTAGASPPAEGAKADAAPAGPRHTVAKGETLTSIAKRYNIPVAELQNANGIKDDRKLQIGQVLSIPAPGAKPSDPSTEKKENP